MNGRALFDKNCYQLKGENNGKSISSECFPFSFSVPASSPLDFITLSILNWWIGFFLRERESGFIAALHFYVPRNFHFGYVSKHKKLQRNNWKDIFLLNFIGKQNRKLILKFALVCRKNKILYSKIIECVEPRSNNRNRFTGWRNGAIWRAATVRNSFTLRESMGFKLW